LLDLRAKLGDDSPRDQSHDSVRLNVMVKASTVEQRTKPSYLKKSFDPNNAKQKIA
jgi:hypothetical protein